MKHGHVQMTDGKVLRTPTYISWQNMKSRCLYPSTPSYPNYGGRGISFAARWASFVDFLADMGIRPEGTTLDRIDNDGNCGPDNCRWATYAEQVAGHRRDAAGRWS